MKFRYLEKNVIGTLSFYWILLQVKKPLVWQMLFYYCCSFDNQHHYWDKSQHLTWCPSMTPGGHYWEYYAGTLSCSQVSSIHPGIKSTDAWFSNDLQWLDLEIKHQNSSPSDGHQGDWHALLPTCIMIKKMRDRGWKHEKELPWTVAFDESVFLFWGIIDLFSPGVDFTRKPKSEALIFCNNSVSSSH